MRTFNFSDIVPFLVALTPVRAGATQLLILSDSAIVARIEKWIHGRSDELTANTSRSGNYDVRRGRQEMQA